MTEQRHEEKRAPRIWERCLGIYCLTLFLILLGILFAEYRLEEPAVELTAYDAISDATGIYLIGINSAPFVDLQTLPRIGPVLAQAIIDYRVEHGPFTSVEQLLEVPGIAEKTLEQLRPLISLD